MPPLLEANPIVAHVESCVVLANLSSGFSNGTPPSTDSIQRRRSSADSTLGKSQPTRLGLSATISERTLRVHIVTHLSDVQNPAPLPSGLPWRDPDDLRLPTLQYVR
jgi:hypothetical protein